MRITWTRKSWVPMDVWTQWREEWTKPEAKAKCEQACLNRRGGTNEPAKPTHTGGSVSARTSAERLEKQLGHPPSLPDVFRFTHTKNLDGKSFIDDKSKETDEKLSRLREQLGLNEVNGDPIYLQTVGGKDKKSRIFGIGSLASQVSSRLVGGNCTSFRSQSIHVDGSLQNQLDKLKEELAKEREESKQLSNSLEEALSAATTFERHRTPTFEG